MVQVDGVSVQISNADCHEGELCLPHDGRYVNSVNRDGHEHSGAGSASNKTVRHQFLIRGKNCVAGYAKDSGQCPGGGQSSSHSEATRLDRASQLADELVDEGIGSRPVDDNLAPELALYDSHSVGEYRNTGGLSR